MILPSTPHRFLIGFALGLLCACLASAQTTAPSADEGKKIVAIEFEGLDSVKAENLLPMLKLKAGETYSAEAARDDIRTLFSTGNFTDEFKVETSPRDNGVAVKIRLRENPVISKISVIGNQKIPSDRIISVLPVREGQIFKNQTGREIQEAVYKLYRVKGYAQTQVLVNPTDVTDYSVNLQIFVNEGTKIEVDKVVLRGNDAFGDFRLKWQMSTKGSWGPFDNYYDETGFQDDLKTLEQFYQARGYFDAKARRGQFAYNEKKGTVTPVVEIEEGVQYRVGTVDVQGVTMFNRVNILIFFDSLRGKPFKATSFQKAVEKVHKIYADQGFLLTEIVPKPTMKPETGVVDFMLDINEKTRVYV
ncbi:MAG: POTRA domain-containing protein, partial [bacterium]